MDMQYEILSIEKEIENNEELQNIRNKLFILKEEINNKKNEYLSYTELYNKLYIEQIREKYSNIYTILARPSNSCFIQKEVCNFLSYEVALKNMKVNSTFDYDNRCRWNYSIIERNICYLSDEEILKIGVVPIDYPYYW